VGGFEREVHLVSVRRFCLNNPPKRGILGTRIAAENATLTRSMFPCVFLYAMKSLRKPKAPRHSIFYEGSIDQVHVGAPSF
jgi:hypothetical protein